MLLHDILDLLLLKVLKLIFLKEEADLSTTTERRVNCVRGDGECTTCSRFPNVLLIIIVLGDDLHTLCNKVGRVETDTELADHGNVGTGGKSLHEALGTRLGDGAKIVDEVRLRHTNTGITKGKNFVLLVGSNANVKVTAGVEDRRLSERCIADFIEGIRAVRDQFTKEDLLVAVEGV